jgi:hypothetical protein
MTETNLSTSETETIETSDFPFFQRIHISSKLTIGFFILVLLTLIVAGLSFFSSVDASH